MNEEDSSDESDDDIVLDQSLAANGTEIIQISCNENDRRQPQQQQQSHSQQKQQTVTQQTQSAATIIAPTIVTIAPPTLKSNKTMNIENNENNNNLMNQQIAALPPPIPFHAELKTKAKAAESCNAEDTNTNAVNVNATNNGNKTVTIINDANKVNDNEEDDVIRPRVDPKLLKMMKLNDANDLSENTFFDLDLDFLSEKPWNNKGVDVTDWFNYGFNEESWRKYCLTQIKMRNIQKKKQQQQQQQQQQQYHHPQSSYLPVINPTNEVMMNVNDNKTAAVTNAATSATSTPFGICFDFQNKGMCLRGSSCRWRHNNVLIKKSKNIINENNHNNVDSICFEFKNKGVCHYGNKCRWRHNINGINNNENVNNEQMKVVNVNNNDSNTNVNNINAKESTDKLQARLQVLLGGNAPNIPDVVSNLLHDDKKNKKKKKRKRKKHKKRRKRSKSKSRSRSASNSRSRSRSRSRSVEQN